MKPYVTNYSEKTKCKTLCRSLSLQSGILSGKEIGFSFPKEFISSDGIAICGIQQAVYRKGKICWQEKEYDELSFTPQQDTSSFFELQDVTIGINFHWERKEVQRFKGELKIIVEDDRLTAINIIPIENYLTSVFHQR